MSVMEERTRGALAAKIGWAGKESAKEHLRACIAAVGKVDLADDASAKSQEAYLEVGRAFKNLMQSLFKQLGAKQGGTSGPESEENIFVRCLQQWTPPSSPEASVTLDKATVVKGKGKRPLSDLSSVSLSSIKQIRDLSHAFPNWTFEISIAKNLGCHIWRKKGPRGSLPFEVEGMTDDAVAAVVEVVFLALYFSESFQRYGGGMGDLPPADEYKFYNQVCTVLTALAAFSDKKRLRVDGWSPEDQMAAAEQQTVDGLTNLLEAATLAISHEQQIRGSVTSGRTEAAVIEEKDEWARHRGCAEVKKSLVNEYNGVAQCIGGMAAQVEENWRFDDEAEERPVRLRRASDEGDTVIVQGETVDVPSSSSVPRTSSTSSAAVEEGAAVPRKETVFGVPTDSKNWLVLHMEATRGIDGKVRAKVTSSGSFHWRGDGRMGLSGLIGALTAAMLRGIDPKDETEWIRRAELIKEAMVLHALEALEDSKLGDTKAAKALKESRAENKELETLRAENAELKARLACLEAAKNE